MSGSNTYQQQLTQLQQLKKSNDDRIQDLQGFSDVEINRSKQLSIYLAEQIQNLTNNQVKIDISRGDINYGTDFGKYPDYYYKNSVIPPDTMYSSFSPFLLSSGTLNMKNFIPIMPKYTTNALVTDNGLTPAEANIMQQPVKNITSFVNPVLAPSLLTQTFAPNYEQNNIIKPAITPSNIPSMSSSVPQNAYNNYPVLPVIRQDSSIINLNHQ